MYFLSFIWFIFQKKLKSSHVFREEVTATSRGGTKEDKWFWMNKLMDLFIIIIVWCNFLILFSKITAQQPYWSKFRIFPKNQLKMMSYSQIFAKHLVSLSCSHFHRSRDSYILGELTFCFSRLSLALCVIHKYLWHNAS